MTTENQKVFLFSSESANSYGYSVGLKKDGSTVSYTGICENEDQYNWSDKRTVYKGKTEDFIAIKNFDYQSGKVSIISNKTDKADPFINPNNSQSINIELDKSGSMDKKTEELYNVNYLKGRTDLTTPLVDIEKIAGEFKKIDSIIIMNDAEPKENQPLVDINKIAGEFKKINKLLNSNEDSGDKKPKIK